MGNVSDSRKQILLNTLDEEVSKYFDVSPPPQIESGDLPVVSDVFQLQILEEDGDTQLSLRWMSGNERKVETILCGGCKTIELNGNLKELVEKLFVKKKVEPVVVVENGEIVVLFLRRENGQQGWFWEGDENDDTKYVGEIEKGRPHGMGTITFGKGKSEGQKYIGEWKDGKYSQGTYTWTNGNKYVGEFKDGTQNGQGTFTSPDGTKYVGEWKDGERNGQGTRTSSDGNKYVGEWKDGKYYGQGTYTWSNGNKYVGEYKDGKKDGQGTYTSGKGKREGDKYVGEWKDGLKQGQGIFTSHEGWEYLGEFKDDQRNGQGTQTWSNGRKYVGEWKDGEPNGQGTETFPDGDKYVGKWKNGEYHGQGTYTYPDGGKLCRRIKG